MTNPWDVLGRRIQTVADRIDALPSIRQATITSVTPLQVTYDTDDDPVDVYGSLASQLAAGDRVLTVRLTRYVWVLGRRGGPSAIDMGSVTITGDGTAYKDVSVTFTAGLFAAPPLMQATVLSANTVPMVVDTVSRSTSGATFRLFVIGPSGFSGTYTVHWEAKRPVGG